MSRSSASWFEHVEVGDRFADFCLWDYEPRSTAGPCLRSSTLLWMVMECSGCSACFHEMLRHLRDRLGPFRTVWCAKEAAGKISFEFYFYDYGRRSRSVSIERVLAILAPYLKCEVSVPETVPYFMFSLDIDDDVLRKPGGLQHVNVYLGNPGSTVSSGICYNVTAERSRLDNFYFFFERAKEREAIVGKIFCSMHLGDGRVPLDHLLWPKSSEAEVIVVANKRFSDGLYFSRTDIEGFLAFLPKTSFPAAIAQFVADHRDQLGHMLFDVGIDYTVSSGEVRILKTAFYGLL